MCEETNTPEKPSTRIYPYSASKKKLTKIPNVPTITIIRSIPVITAPELLCVIEELKDVDEVNIVAIPVFAVVVALDIELVVIVEFSVKPGMLTRNQSAATSAPKPVLATKFVRLKPTQLSTENPGVVKLLNKGIYSAKTAKFAGLL
jgi:hypothetical protein